ncbi:KEOPS complex subunit Cgi121 [Halomarina halobia]|uniref:KEOPS complex subunit Cgi121 n=1 Tax=Halomarina halobia TaxID=3033386 RepID=A0ABD6ABX2_9EURY|nr:KEOPS complex subunit Cgi121 [Halomarina sp. PSR21]
MRLVEGLAAVEDVDAFVTDLAAVGDEHGCAVQAFDARMVVGERHLRRAVELANRAHERGEAVARDRAVEILLYAAGRRQIDRALAMGVREGEDRPVVVVVDGEGGRAGAAEAAAAAAVEGFLEPAETLGDYDEERVREYFDVTDAELAATDAGLEALVCERVALLTVEK